MTIRELFQDWCPPGDADAHGYDIRSPFVQDGFLYATDIHPEAKHGGAPGKAGGGKCAKVDKLSSFAVDTAAQTGQSPRSVRRGVAIGQSIDSQAAEDISDTPVANNKSQLKQLAALPAEQQRAVAAKIKEGVAATVAEAIGDQDADDEPEAALRPSRDKTATEEAWAVIEAEAEEIASDVGNRARIADFLDAIAEEVSNAPALAAVRLGNLAIKIRPKE